jgi:hypothetical protein
MHSRKTANHQEGQNYLKILQEAWISLSRGYLPREEN